MKSSGVIFFARWHQGSFLGNPQQVPSPYWTTVVQWGKHLQGRAKCLPWCEGCWSPCCVDHNVEHWSWKIKKNNIGGEIFVDIDYDLVSFSKGSFDGIDWAWDIIEIDWKIQEFLEYLSSIRGFGRWELSYTRVPDFDGAFFFFMIDYIGVNHWVNFWNKNGAKLVFLLDI